MIDSSTFPASLKLSHITPVFKKGSKNSTKNYRPVSILPNISKIYKRNTKNKQTYKQMSNYFGNFFSLNSSVGFAKVSVRSTVF